MALKVGLVAASLGIRTPEEVVKPDLEKGGLGGKGGDMAADPLLVLVGPDHQGHGVPADQALDAPFDFPAARERDLVLRMNTVDIRGVGRERQLNPGNDGPSLQLAKQIAGPLL